MDFGTITRLLALISSIIFTLTTVPVHSRVRCKGRWKSHMCFGGNGKRSDPNMAPQYIPYWSPASIESRRSALQSAVRSSYATPDDQVSLRSLLRRDSDYSISEKQLAKEITSRLEEQLYPGDKVNGEELPLPQEEDEADENDEDAFAMDDDVTDGDEEMTPSDVETVRDIFATLRKLRRRGSRQGSFDTRDFRL